MGFMTGTAFQKFSMFLMATAAFKLSMGADILLKFFPLWLMTEEADILDAFSIGNLNG